MAAGDDRRMVRPGITFRVFVSSTFRDFTMERNALQERVWPRLRELCMRHGARFQAIDLRWGVSEEAGQDQRAMEICLEEIRRCQQVTPRPNFIVLLGDRYGWRPLPAIIPQNEFGAILNATTDPDDRALISEWYALDENADPHEYCLRARGETSYDEWGPIEQHLHRVLLDGARAAGLDDAAMVKFERSATEQEIIAGALEARKGNAFGYIRTIEGMPEDERAADFIDMESGLRDPEAKRLMGALKSRLAEHLPEEYRHQITAHWDGGGLSDEHLDAFCEQVHQDLERAILEETEKLEAVDELDQEVLAHAEFGRQRRQHFIGREEIIDQVMGYVECGGYPLVIHGRSGSGKSALMAKLAADLEDRDVTLITRYIGATPASTQMHSLLQSLCQQIHREFGFAGLAEQWQAPEVGENEPPPPNPYEIPTDPNELRQAFTRFLDLVPENRTLVVVLDALDQLSPENNAHSLHWLPFELPDNVRIIASVLEREDDAGRCHQSAAGRLRERPEALIPLPELSIDQAESILDAWLAEASRFLQPEQRGDVLEKLHACQEGHALFLRLAFEEARRWRSFEPLPLGADDEPGLSDTVPGVIADMLARLEQPANHGRTLVGRALGYLRAARYGLAEDEMLQVLSADGEVMADFAQRSPTERDKSAAEQLKVLPPVVWSRLYFDLRPYLVERAADGTSLLNFYHRQVGEAVEQRYLGDETHRLRSHQKLGEYFGGAVPGVEQPNWVDEDARLPNYRRMSELPWQLTEARDWDTLTGVFTGYDFLDAKLHATGVQSLIEDYQRAVAAQARPESEQATSLRLIGDALRLSAHVLADDPDQLSPQLLGRLLHFQDAPTTALLGQANGPGGKPWLRPLTPSLTPPGGPLLRTLTGHSWGVYGVAVTADGRRAVSASGDRTLKVWDLESGAELRTLAGHTSGVFAVAVTPDGRGAVSGSADNTVKVWDLDSGEALRTLTGHTDEVRAVAVIPDGRRAVSASYDKTLKVWDLESGECLCTLSGHTSRVNAVAVTPDGRRAVSASHGTLKVWDLTTGEETYGFKGHRGDVTAVAVAADGRLAVSASDDRTSKVWDLESGAELRTLTGHTWVVYAVSVTADGRRAVSASWDGTLRVWDVETGAVMRTFNGHGDPLWAVAVTADGRRAISGSQDLKVWDLGSSAELCTATGHTDSVMAVAVTADGRRAISASLDRTLKVWELETGAELRTLIGHSNGVNAVAMTADGRRAISGAKDNALKVWNLDTGQELRTLTGHGMGVTAVAVTPDGRRAISASWDTTLKVWHLDTGAELHTLSGHSSVVWAVAVTGDGTRVVSASSDQTLKVWDLETGAELRTLHENERWIDADRNESCRDHVAVTADGRRAISNWWDSTLTVWDLDTGAELHTLSGHAVDAVAVTGDGTRVVSASFDQTLKVWDLATGVELHTLRGHTGSVNVVAATGDGTRVVSASYDRTLKVWDLETGAELCTFVLEASLRSCAVAPDGVVLVAGDCVGHIHFLRLENVTPAPPLCTAWRPGEGEPPAFGCLHCRVWSEISQDVLGTELPCPNCGKAVKLNEFVIEADWRPVAAAWKPEES